MSVELKAQLNANVVFAYDTVSIDKIDRNALRKIFGTPDVNVVDVPQMLVLISPLAGIALQINDRTIQVSDQRMVNPGTKISEIAHQAHRLVSPPAKIVAYGINFDIIVGLPKSQPAEEILRRAFLQNRSEVEEILGGEIHTPLPRYIFTRSGKRYDLAMEPVLLDPGKEPAIKARLNVHIEGRAVPDKTQLQNQFISEFAEFLAVFERFIEE
jgi:hypothetical protein